MTTEIVWLDAPNSFASSAGAERTKALRGALGASAGEALHANTFPLKPDGTFTVVAIYTGVTEDGFVQFSPDLISAFNLAAAALVARFTTEERAALDALIRQFHEVGSTYGASDEAIGITVPTRMVAEAKVAIEKLFATVHPAVVAL